MVTPRNASGEGNPADEAFWSRVVEHASDAVIVYDSALRFVALNRAAATVYGLEPKALVGRAREDIVGSDEITPRLREVLRTQKSVTMLNEVGGAVGTRVYETVYQSIRDPRTSAAYLVGISRELTSARDRRIRETRPFVREAEKFRSLFENSGNSIVALALDGTITDVNATALAWGGYGREEVLGTHVSRWLDEDDLPHALAAIDRALRGESATFGVTLARRDGNPGELQCTTSPIFTDGEPTGVFIVFNDISDRRGAERALAKQHERIRRLYLCAASGDVSAEEQIQAALELGCRLLGLEYGAVFDSRDEGGAIAFAVSLDASESGEAPIPEWLARETVRANGLLDIAEGAAERSPEFQTAVASLGAFLGTSIEVGGAHFGAVCFAGRTVRDAPFPAEDRDFVRLIAVLIGTIIERRRARSHLRSLAYYDALTGLPNRALLAERLDAALGAGREAGTRCAVLFLDLDHFKDINDTLGHALGDRLLQVAAERIVGCVRQTETVARMGGDEFIVVMPGVRDRSESTALAERLLRAIEGPITISGFEQYTTTSIGIAISPDDGQDADALIKHADIAMYRAKDRGRNCYELYRPDLDLGMALRLAQETALRKGLERGEFRTFFQPLIDLGARRVYGVEALARWQHSTLSLLSPEDFIATAESSGLIVKLGEFVLDDACRHVLAWREAGLGELRLSVNLSARQFREPNLLESLTAILTRTGFPPSLLDLEITESVAMSDAAGSVAIMRALKNLGVRMLLDDFGTGYSSLAYLRRFPLDGLKIDRAFTSGIGRERDDETIVEAVLAMAHKLGLHVVAEGVETQEQVDFLLREHCRYVQGTYYAPALTANGCERYVRAWTELRGPQQELRSAR